jgi:transporter family-2 protein
MKPSALVLVAVLAGSLIPLQSAMNSRIGQALHHPLYATLVSFGLAFILALVAWLVVNPAPPKWEQLASTPWYTYAGGVLGVTSVTAVLILVPRLGVTGTIVGVVTGQLMLSVVLDQFGILVESRPANVYRILGCLGLLVSLLLVQKGVRQ